LGAWTREHWPGRLAQLRQALEAQLQQQNWIEAQRIVDSARSTYPDTAFAAFLAGILGVSRGQADEAEQHFLEAMALAPRFPTVVAALARAWARQHGAAGAGDRLMRLAQDDPGFASARSIAARAYIEARDPNQAEAALKRGLELQPESPVPYQQLAEYYSRLDRVAEAVETGRQGLDRFPHALDLQLMLSQMSAADGATNDAIRIYEDVLLRRPDLDVPRYRIGVLLAARDKGEALPQRFLEIAHQLQADVPSDPLLLDALGWMLYHAGHKRRARELLEAAVKGAPEEPSPHFHLAAVYAQENRKDLAREEVKAALDSHRPFAERLEALRFLRENR
jgi:predicted Zn-dependent protease